MKRTVLLGVVSAGAMLLGMAAASAEELHIYAWADEVPQEVIDDFIKETGIEVESTTESTQVANQQRALTLLHELLGR